MLFSVQVSLGGVGEIYKIRLELQSQNPYDKPSWKVKRVSLQLPTVHFTTSLHFVCVCVWVGAHACIHVHTCIHVCA